MASDQASAAQPPSAEPTSSASPDAAKYERGHWFYRQTFPSRNGSTTRWFPSTRYSKSALEQMAPLRARWSSNLHAQDLPHSAVAAVVAAAVSLVPESVEQTLNAHLLRCAYAEVAAVAALSEGLPSSLALATC